MEDQSQFANGYGGPERLSKADSEDGKSKCNQPCVRKAMKSNLFLILMVIGISAGIGMGLGLRFHHPEFGMSSRNVMYLGFPGDLLLRMLKMCIIPLVVSSLIVGMARLPSRSAGRIGGYAVLYYMITTFMAVLLGLLLVGTIQPGKKGRKKAHSAFETTTKGKPVNPIDSLLDLIRNAFPSNVIGACTQQTKTVYTYKTINETKFNDTGNYYYEGEGYAVDSFKPTTISGTNVLGLVVFSVTLGVLLGRMGKKGQVLVDAIDGLQEGIIQIVRIIIWYTPVGVAFLVASKIIAMDDLESDFEKLGWYMMTVLVGLAIHGFIVLPIIYVAFTRRNPIIHLVNMGHALLTALGTASSSATMPITFRCLEDNAGIDPRITRFTIPVGATINMDGTALYEAVASIFIAQSINHPMDAGNYVIVSITATAAAIGAAGVPEAGLVTMLIVLTAIGLPTDQIGLILAVDWFLDRCRTCINVWGDAIGASVVEKLSTKDLLRMDEEDAKEAALDHGLEGGIANAGYRYDASETKL